MTSRTVVDRYDALFVDLDGVVYRGDGVVPGAAEALARARERGARILFLTNNSSRTPQEVADKLSGLGVLATWAEILTSGLATAAMLRREGYAGRSAFVIGEQGVREALQSIGVRVVDGDPDAADLVVVGWDRSVDYAKLRTASVLVQRGARLVATNADRTYPAPDGLLWPGGGAILAAVTTTTDAVPTVVGKPAAPLFEAAAEATGARTPLVVGDRLDTDVAGAAGMGWDSLLVLTGATTAASLAWAAHLPTYLGEDLSILARDPPPARFRTAGPADVPALSEILASADLHPDDIETRLEHTVVSDADDEGRGALSATASVEPFAPFGLVRSVAVRDDLRGLGLGMLAVAAVVGRARKAGLFRFALLTETAAPFFARLGFTPVDRSSLPSAIREGPQATHCDQGATAMVLQDQGGGYRPQP